MQARKRGLLALTGALLIGLSALPATAEPPAHAIPRGSGLTDVPFPTSMVSGEHDSRSSQRAPAAPPTTEEVTPVDPHGGFVDGCDDAVSSPDVRRLFVVIDPAGDAEFSLMLCDGADPKAALSGSYAWVTRAGDQGQNYRRIDVEPDNGDGLTVTIYRGIVNLDGNVSWVPLDGSHNARWRMDTDGPAPRLVVVFAASALGISGGCDPDAATPCVAMTFAALDGGGTPIDTVPDGPTGPPDISDGHSLFWPSPCGVTTGQNRAIDSRAVLAVERGRERQVTTALRHAGYPATPRAVGVVSVEAGATDAALAAFADLPDVRQARRHAARQPTVTPRDPQYDGGVGQWSLPRINAPAAWDTTTGSESARLGILDDGIDGTRDDFAGRVAGGYDAVNEAALPAGSNSDLGWHGTAVAAVAAATGSTSASATGMAGVDWKSQLVPIRVWSHNRCFDEVAYLRGLKWAADHGNLDVLNLSLGGPDPIEAIGNLPGERTTIRRLVQQDTIVVAAGGNNAWIDMPTSYPAALPDVIAVGATGVPASDGTDQLAPYSNRGRYVDVVAPGGAGTTTATGILTATDPTVHGAYFAPENGTSFSAPMVAGAAALYRSVQPDSTPADFTRALLATAEDLGSGMAGFDTSFGFGMLDLASLVTAGPSQTSPAIRTAGRDRYATAAVASQFAYRFPAQVRTVFLATGADFPDALAGAPFAAQRHGPILLTMKDGLPQATIEELARLKPDDVVLFGGPGTIAPTVESQLAAVLDYQPAGSCSVAFGDDRRSSCRLAGSNRYETAGVIAAQGWAQADVVYIATGGNYPDALAGGATAAAFDAPLLLTAPTELPTSTREQLIRLQPRLVIVLGGQASVSDGVAQSIASIPSVQAVVRASGPNRYRTAIAALCPDLLVCISDTRYVTIASGAGFADALAGSAIAAALRAPLLLADPSQPDADALAGAMQYLEPERAVILGGTGTLPPSVETAVSQYVIR